MWQSTIKVNTPCDRTPPRVTLGLTKALLSHAVNFYWISQLGWFGPWICERICPLFMSTFCHQEIAEYGPLQSSAIQSPDQWDWVQDSEEQNSKEVHNLQYIDEKSWHEISLQYPEEKNIGATISINQDIWCLPYEGFIYYLFLKHCCLYR